MQKNEKNINDLTKDLLEMMKANNEFLTHQFGEFLRQRNLWIVQIITIASAILGGFFLSRQQTNLVISFGVSLLLIVIFIGLMLIYRSSKNFADALAEAHGKSSDYYVRYFIYLDLSKKQELTQEEQKIKMEIEEYLKNFFLEIGVIKEDGTLGSIYEKLYQGRKIDWVNYLLICAFFLSGLILTFSTYIAKYLGLSIR